jgi:hypothetical protein
LRPDDRAREEQGLLVDYELGGVAIQDPSQGLRVRVWKLWVDVEDVRIAPLDALGSATTLFSGAGITEVTLSFDNNMMPDVAYLQNDDLKLRWFDLSQSPPRYVTDDFGPGIATPYLAFDDKRPQLISASDVMLFYVRDRKVWVRLLRDRWLTEYEWADIPSHAGRILAAGMSRGNRMQLKFAVPPDFMLDLEMGGMGFTRLDLGSASYGGFSSSTTDQLFIGDATGFAEFAAIDSAPLEYEWRSKEHLFKSPTTFAAGLVDCVGDVEVTVMADGVDVVTVTASGVTPFRIPAHAQAFRWSVKLVGTAKVKRVTLGSSFEEVQRG